MEHLDQEAPEFDVAGLYAKLMEFRQDIERRQDLKGAQPAIIASNMNRLAFYAACTGEYVEAARATERCLTAYRQAPTIDEEMLAIYLMTAAYTLAQAQCFDKAVAYGDDALYLFFRTQGQESEFVRTLLRDMACMRKGEAREYLDNIPPMLRNPPVPAAVKK
jgi:hypothetical protein